MTLYTRTRLRRGLLEEYVAPHMDVLGMDVAESILFSPTSSIDRMHELSVANADEPVRRGRFEKMHRPSAMVDAGTARSRIAEEKLDLTVPDAGIRQEALDILIERKKDERRRQDLHNRAPGGLGFGALRFGTMLGASMLDPLNIATAFVPVVSHARSAQMLARFGAWKGRAMVGAIEGTVGAAMVEPIIYGAAQHEQADYDLQDSMLNLALGTALGGGLHVGIGAVGDVLARRHNRMSGVQLEQLPQAIDDLPFEVRESALRTAVAQAVEGRNVNVDPILQMGGVTPARFGPESRFAVDDGLIDLPAIAAAADSITPDDVRAAVEGIDEIAQPPVPDGMVRMYHGGDPVGDSPLWFTSSRQYAKGRGRGLWYVDLPRSHEVFSTDIPGQSVDEGFTVNAELPAEIAAQRRQLSDAVAAIDEGVAQVADEVQPETADENMRRLVELNEAFDKSIIDLGTAIKAEIDAGRPYVATNGDLSYSVTPSTSEPGVFQITTFLKGEPIGHVNSRPKNLGREAMQVMGQDAVQKQRTPAARTPAPPVDIAAAARNNHAPENVRLADFDASKAADARLAEVPKDDAAAVDASLETATSQLLDTVAGLSGLDAQTRYELMAGVRAKMLREISQGAPPKTRQPKSLFQFLADEGGLRLAGELKAMDLDRAFIPGRGRLVRNAGLTLDEARRRAVEAGYLDDPGALFGGESTSTIDDLLDAIGNEASGQRVFSRFDDQAVADRMAREEYEALRADLDRAIDDIAGVLTDDIPEPLKRMAVELRMREGLDPEEALARAFHLDEAADDTALPGRYDDGDEVPFDELPPFDPDGTAQQRGEVSGDGDYSSGQGRAVDAAGEELRVDGGSDRAPSTQGAREQAERIKARLESRATAPASEPVFYSALLRSVEGMQQPKGTAQQWAAMIQKAPGVKKEELEWTGVIEWLGEQKGPVTREQVAGFIRANQIEVKEVTKGDSISRDEALAAVQRGENVWPTHRLDGDPYGVEDIERTTQSVRFVRGGQGTKFSSYQLPGGEGYRELLLTLPHTPQSKVKPSEAVLARHKAEWDRLVGEIREARSDLTIARVEMSPRYGEIMDRVSALERQQDDLHRRSIEETIAESRGRLGGEAFTTGHFDEANVLAHVRFNERYTSADGTSYTPPQKMLFIEEMQSDWHQKGRKQGYRDEKARNFTIKERPTGGFGVFDGNGVEVGGAPTHENAQRVLAQYQSGQLSSESGVPSAPFKTTWPELAFKRMLRYAVDNGFDSVAWTPGDVQADRYDLSRYINSVGYQRRGETLFNVSVRDKQDHTILSNQSADAGWLEDHLGKEIAQKVINGEGHKEGAFTFLEDLDLKVGGEGMRGFYDAILPATVNKLVKRWGGKVGTTRVPADREGWHITPPDRTTHGKWMVKSSDYNSKGLRFDTEAEAKAALEDKIRKIDAHTVDITEAMRGDVRKGLPLFNLNDERWGPATAGILDSEPAIRDELQGLANSILGHGLARVDVAPRLDETGQRLGVWDPDGRVIEIALTVGDPRTTLRHETIHAMREVGLVTTAEWGALTRQAKRRWMEQYNIRERYAHYRETLDLDDAQIEEIFIEEAVAEAFGNFRKREVQTNSPLDRIFDRIVRFIEALQNLLKGYGFRTAEGVLEGFEGGAATQRPAGAGGGRGFEVYAREGAGLESRSRNDQPGLPGAERESLGQTLQRRADARLKGKTAQNLSMDEGLFGDAHKQQDLFGAMQQAQAAAEALDAPDLFGNAMMDAQKAADDAEAYGKATRAAAGCQLRKGSE